MTGAKEVEAVEGFSLDKEHEKLLGDALSLKDTQIRALNDQNRKLLHAVKVVEERNGEELTASTALRKEVLLLKKALVEKTTEAQSLHSRWQRHVSGVTDIEAKLDIMRKQNAELLKLTNSHEKEQKEMTEVNNELRCQVEKLSTEKAQVFQVQERTEQQAKLLAQEKLTLLEEVRLSRLEIEQLRQKNLSLESENRIETDALKDQLRLRKQEQYATLAKLHAADQQYRRSSDSVEQLQQKMKLLTRKMTDAKTSLSKYEQHQAQYAQEERHLEKKQGELQQEVSELRKHLEAKEGRLQRSTEETRHSADQVRDLSQKIFELLERLKLSEIAKNKGLTLIKQKDSRIQELARNLNRNVKNLAQESKRVVMLGLDREALLKQLSALKSTLSQTSDKLKKEIGQKLAIAAQKALVEEKQLKLSNRLAFLLDKLRANEEELFVKEEKAANLEKRLRDSEKQVELKSEEAAGLTKSRRVLAESLRMKDYEVEKLSCENSCLKASLSKLDTKSREGNYRRENVTVEGCSISNTGTGAEGTKDLPVYKIVQRSKADQQLLHIIPIEGRGKERAALLLKSLGIKPISHAAKVVDGSLSQVLTLLTKLHYAQAVKRSAVTRSKQLETALEAALEQVRTLETRLVAGEESRKTMVMRYVTAVLSGNSATGRTDVDKTDLQLAEEKVDTSLNLSRCHMGEEECHALMSVLKGRRWQHSKSDLSASTAAQKLDINLTNNRLNDECVSILASLFDSQLWRHQITVRQLDLRRNEISQSGALYLADYIKQNCSVVRHVYVHPGGRIECLGTENQAGTLRVTTLSVIDCRENCTGTGLRKQHLTSKNLANQAKLTKQQTKQGRMGPPSNQLSISALNDHTTKLGKLSNRPSVNVLFQKHMATGTLDRRRLKGTIYRKVARSLIEANPVDVHVKKEQRKR